MNEYGVLAIVLWAVGCGASYALGRAHGVIKGWKECLNHEWEVEDDELKPVEPERPDYRDDL